MRRCFVLKWFVVSVSELQKQLGHRYYVRKWKARQLLCCPLLFIIIM